MIYGDLKIMMDKGGLIVFSPLSSSSSKKSSNNVTINLEKRRARLRRAIFRPIIIFPYHRLRKTLTNLTTSKFKV